MDGIAARAQTSDQTHPRRRPRIDPHQIAKRDRGPRSDGSSGDRTPNAVRRPAQLGERCTSCGAATRGRAHMVTELVDVGPVRALRVVACSECPDQRRLRHAL